MAKDLRGHDIETASPHRRTSFLLAKVGGTTRRSPPDRLKLRSSGKTSPSTVIPTHPSSPCSHTTGQVSKASRCRPRKRTVCEARISARATQLVHLSSVQDEQPSHAGQLLGLALGSRVTVGRRLQRFHTSDDQFAQPSFFNFGSCLCGQGTKQSNHFDNTHVHASAEPNGDHIVSTTQVVWTTTPTSTHAFPSAHKYCPARYIRKWFDSDYRGWPPPPKTNTVTT